MDIHGGYQNPNRPHSPRHGRITFQIAFLFTGGLLARKMVDATAPSPAMRVAKKQKTADPETIVYPPVSEGLTRLLESVQKRRRRAAVVVCYIWSGSASMDKLRQPR
jgi:hypothetical protein